MNETNLLENYAHPAEPVPWRRKNRRRRAAAQEQSKASFFSPANETSEKCSGFEKDLFAIGFFSAPKYRHAKKNPKQQKIVKLTSSAETGIETRAEILTHAKYGLPTTGDLTKYLAFLKIVKKRYKNGRVIQNPIQFTHYELLQTAHLTRSKAAQDQVAEWLERLDNTQIIIHGERKDDGAEEKRLYKLFKEVHLSGRTSNEGKKIKFNTVWLSDWAIKNICEKPWVPVDFETYQKLKNDVAKLLVVHLQVWLYASRRQACFEKFYARFCELLDLKEKRSRSEIIRQLSPAFNELKRYEYISDWELVPGSTELKIKIRRGAKLEGNLKKGLSFTGESENLKSESDSNHQPETTNEPIDDEKAGMLKRLTDLGIYTELAKGLMERFPLEKLALRSAWAVKELHLKQQREEVKKPGGLIYKIISSEDEPDDSETYDPPYFEIDRQSFEVADRIDEPLADKEFEKRKWMETQFSTFCLTQALKNPQLDLQMFANCFDAGQDIFNEFLAELHKRLGKQIYQCWFETLSFAGFSGNLLYVAGGEINRDWVLTYYEQMVKDVFQKINLPDLQLGWMISDSVPPGAGLEYFYSRHLIKRYQDDVGITLEEFYRSNQQDLDENFERFLECSFGKSDIGNSDISEA